jgi:hypothetical protein
MVSPNVTAATRRGITKRRRHPQQPNVNDKFEQKNRRDEPPQRMNRLKTRRVATTLNSKAIKKPSTSAKVIPYLWMLYTIPRDPILSRSKEPTTHAPHVYKKVRTGMMKTSFKSGTVAREVFLDTMGENPRDYHFMSDLVVVYNPTKGKVDGFFAYKRSNPSASHTGGSKLYTAVRRVASKRGLVKSTKDLSSLKWSRLHGKVTVSKR